MLTGTALKKNNKKKNINILEEILWYTDSYICLVTEHYNIEILTPKIHAPYPEQNNWGYLNVGLRVANVSKWAKK